MVKTLAVIPLVTGTWLLGAWFTMLLVGVIHAQWITILPTIGYPTALAINALTGTSLLVRVSIFTAIKEMIK